MTDLVERLRMEAGVSEKLDATNSSIEVMREAADEIERLRAFHDAWVESQVADATGGPELSSEKRKALIARHAAVRARSAIAAATGEG